MRSPKTSASRKTCGARLRSYLASLVNLATLLRSSTSEDTALVSCEIALSVDILIMLAVWDLIDDETSHKLITEFADSGKVVA